MSVPSATDPENSEKITESSATYNQEDNSLVWKQSDSRRISQLLMQARGAHSADRKLGVDTDTPQPKNINQPSENNNEVNSRKLYQKPTEHNPQRLNQNSTSASGFRPVVQRRKLPRPIVVEKCLPEINDKAPAKEERQNLCQVEAEPFMDKSCGGFRFFVRKFTDELFKKCLGNPSFDTLEGYAPKNLKYIYILRNAWKSLELTQDECIEEFNISEQQLKDRQWVCSVEPEFLPCPLCANSNFKRYNARELMAHLSLSHASIRFYACHLCHKVFQSAEALKTHSNCDLFLNYINECNDRAIELTFDFAYMSLVCAECGLQMIVSPRCHDEHFATTLINCLFSHSSESLQVLMIFSCLELSANPLKLSFSNCASNKPSVCKLCNKKFEDVNELEQHLYQHKDQLNPTKCPCCPSSFLSQKALSGHLLEHLNKLPAITKFLSKAVVFPAALDRNPEIRVGATSTRSIDSISGDNSDEMSHTQKESNGSCDTHSQQITWKQFNEQISTNNSSSSCASHLQVVYNEKTRKVIVENTIDGAISKDNLYQCMKCSTIITSDHHTKLHLKDCLGLPTLMQASACFNNKSSKHLMQLFDSSNFAFNRIKCGLCAISHCSIVALQKHCVLNHAVFCKFVGGSGTVQQYGETVQQKSWLTSKFDRELIKLIKASPLPPCKSEFDTFYEDYLTFGRPGSRYVPEDEDEDQSSVTSFSANVNLIKSFTHRNDNHANGHTSDRSSQQVKMEVTDNDFEAASHTNGSTREDKAQRLEIPHQHRDTLDHTICISPPKLVKVKTEAVESSECFTPNLNNIPTENPIATPQVDGRVYCCFLCAQPQANTQELSEHFLSHPEHWSKCPICVKHDSWDREDFAGKMDFYKHMKNVHVRVQDNFAYCSFCCFSITASQIQVSVNAMIRHMNSSLAEEIVGFHRQKAHRLVYDRLICSACKSGFHSRDVFLKHTCEKAFRCECNPSKCFKRAIDFYSHIRESLEEKFSHAPIKSLADVKTQDRRIIVNQEYEKVCKAQLEALKPQEPEEKQSVKEQVIRKIRQKVDTSTLPKKPKRNRRRTRKRVQEDVPAEVAKVVNEIVNVVSNGAIQALLSSKGHGAEHESMLERRKSFKKFRKNPVCDVCGQKFRLAFELLQHKRAVHDFQDNRFPLPQDVQCYLCAACCLAFQTMDDYVEHMRGHNQLTGCKSAAVWLSIYACSICCIHYDNEFNLLFHMAETHKTVLAYFCKHCRTLSTHGPTIIEHFVKYKCRKMLTIEYLGLCDASQIKFQPKSSHDYIKKTKLRKMKIVKQAKCYHKCLLARNEPWITCKECNCPIPLSKWRNAFDRDGKLTTTRANDEPGIVDPKANFRRLINLHKLIKLGEEKALVHEELQDLSGISQALFSEVNSDGLPIQPEKEAVAVARDRFMEGTYLSQPNATYDLPRPVSGFPRPVIGPLKVLPNQKMLMARKYHIPDSVTKENSPIERRQPEVVMQRTHYAGASGLHHPDEMEYLQSKASPSSSIASQFDKRNLHMFRAGLNSRPKLLPRVLRRKAAANLDQALFEARHSNPARHLRLDGPSTSAAGSPQFGSNRQYINEASSESDEDQDIIFEDQEPPRKKVMPSGPIPVFRPRFSPAVNGKPFIVLSPSTCQRKTQAAKMPPVVVLKPVHSILGNEEDVKNKINFMKVMPATELYLCVTCNTTSNCQMEAVVHQFEKHAIKEIKYNLNCPVCRENFSDLSLFYAHISQRPGHLFEQSKWCNFRFRDPSSVNKHNLEHEKMQLSQIKQQSCGGIKCCGLCGSVKDWWVAQLPSSQTIIDHTAFHGFETINVCRICDKPIKKDMKNHFQNSHLCVDFENPTNYKFECKTCKRELPKDQLAEHFQINHTYTLVEFVPGKEGRNLVITAKQELNRRFFPESK
uniref:C2H2-type domain-containing protein n=1 Tax=Ditylenchus dipsaci TaxID=166011 RepID=A0A915CLP4_9BILA